MAESYTIFAARQLWRQLETSDATSNLITDSGTITNGELDRSESSEAKNGPNSTQVLKLPSPLYI